ncbi:hypothetical protein SH1V18_11960 [Vallitalea longa]|uniref:Uncharacterized protein n=1 Tax=Vallitalea longa TaxID=2936439 RepID=A0A9W5Y9R5_9FIRM|nr:hypothetical protein [Vallitalea longa]GKX28716.1 hypothetical protein SH1V18_11960 [Vallitalea longa]
MELTLLKQESKLSDLVGNIINSPMIDYRITVKDKGIKPLPDLYFTNPIAKIPIKQVHMGKHLTTGVAFKYKLFSKDVHKVETVLNHQFMDNTWREVKDLDIIKVKNDYYIGVVEIDTYNRAIRYSIMKAK